MYKKRFRMQIDNILINFISYKAAFVWNVGQYSEKNVKGVCGRSKQVQTRSEIKKANQRIILRHKKCFFF